MSDTEKVTMKLTIDAPPGAIRPGAHCEEICKNILKQEYKKPDYTFMGEWGWTFEVNKSDAEDIQEKIMKFLTALYPNCIRYGSCEI